jgi:hypothetical protein
LAIPAAAGLFVISVAVLFGWNAGTDVSHSQTRFGYYSSTSNLRDNLGLTTFESTPKLSCFQITLSLSLTSAEMLVITRIKASNRCILYTNFSTASMIEFRAPTIILSIRSWPIICIALYQLQQNGSLESNAKIAGFHYFINGIKDSIEAFNF